MPAYSNTKTAPPLCWSGEVQAEPQVAALRAAGVAGEKGLDAFGQRPGGKAGAGILHRDGKAPAGGMEGQGYFASRGV